MKEREHLGTVRRVVADAVMAVGTVRRTLVGAVERGRWGGSLSDGGAGGGQRLRTSGPTKRVSGNLGELPTRVGGTSASFRRVSGNLGELPTRVGEPRRASDACQGTSASFRRVSGNLGELPTRVGEPRRASDACQGTSASFRRVSGNLGELPTRAGEPRRASDVRGSATVSVRTASPWPPRGAPAVRQASSRCTSRAPRTASAHGLRSGDARRTRTHRSILAPPALSGG
ncbi:uncharacterized protein CMC5_066970 [Chondromyces crocatus]|uniref:Uncharacterized protein n=1 Tax=Chondromyces crocatus TaxID=52 RepID=A0A0K1ENP9_CHOCO|nr:uncharacterized protein CMC5_066970 [Chondromyces crocatus]